MNPIFLMSFSIRIDITIVDFQVKPIHCCSFLSFNDINSWPKLIARRSVFWLFYLSISEEKISFSITNATISFTFWIFRDHWKNSHWILFISTDLVLHISPSLTLIFSLLAWLSHSLSKIQVLFFTSGEIYNFLI